MSPPSRAQALCSPVQSFSLLVWVWLLAIYGVAAIPATTAATAAAASPTPNVNAALKNVSVPSGSSLPIRCEIACGVLKLLYKNNTSFPGDSLYTQEQAYWSQQQSQTSPVCRFSPSSASEVSVALEVIEVTQCQFAVKSGGHADFVGASNIQGGITIDLINLNSLSVSADKTTTYVGTGNHWRDVYSYLDPQNLAVIGGRNGDIGVGGLTLGGGISFFSGYYGWALDNVKNYEVVIASGAILNVNESSYPDLYYALRGGGNNFGVVTRMDLNTFNHGLMWGGMTVYTTDKNVSIYNALENFNTNAPKDPSAAVIVAAALVQGNLVFSNDYEYTNATVDPPILQNFTSIPNISDTTRITTLLNLTDELAATQPPGYRQRFVTATFGNSASLMGQIFDIWVSEVTPLEGVVGFLPSLVFQPITLDIITKFGTNGGNCIGITAEDGPLIVMDMDFQWNSTADDARVLGAQKSIFDQAVALAQAQGLYNEYIYQNYAGPGQNVFAGYNATNQARLISISKKYDPNGVFQTLEPGYFKVTDTAPSTY